VNSQPTDVSTFKTGAILSRTSPRCGTTSNPLQPTRYGRLGQPPRAPALKRWWLRTALRNLDDEASYIAADDPAAAKLVVARVLGAVAQLAENPALGRSGRVHGTRELVVLKTRYIVPYRVHNDTVEILRAFHTSRRRPGRW